MRTGAVGAQPCATADLTNGAARTPAVNRRRFNIICISLPHFLPRLRGRCQRLTLTEGEGNDDGASHPLRRRMTTPPPPQTGEGLFPALHLDDRLGHDRLLIPREQD